MFRVYVLRPVVHICRTKRTGRDRVPSRPEAERPQVERPRSANTFVPGLGVGGGWAAAMEGGGVGGVAGGHAQFQAGLGFFPSLFGLQFVSDIKWNWWSDGQ